MCTLVVLQGITKDYPLIVVHNRDERISRPFSSPSLIGRKNNRKVLAPTDLEQGGTWVGLTESGLLCAITNQDEEETYLDVPSRGKLVSDCLALGDSYKVLRFLQSLPENQYNSFNMVFGYPFNLRVAKVHRGNPVFIAPIPFEQGGLDIFTNDCKNPFTYLSKRVRVRELVSDLVDNSKCRRLNLEDILKTCKVMMSDHANHMEGHHMPICVHGEHVATTSTTVLVYGQKGSQSNVRLFYSKGNPCGQDSFSEYTFLLEG